MPCALGPMPQANPAPIIIRDDGKDFHFVPQRTLRTLGKSGSHELLLNNIVCLKSLDIQYLVL